MQPQKEARLEWLAAQRKKGQRVTIGFTGISNFTSYIGREYSSGIQKAAQDYDVNLINFLGVMKNSIFDDLDLFKHYQAMFRYMKAPFIDGLVTWASTLNFFTDEQSITRLFNSLKPLPMVDIGFKVLEDTPSVRIDNDTVIRELMTHLVADHGYRRFAYVGNEDIKPHLARLELWKRELVRLGLAESAPWVFMTPTMNEREIARCADRLCRQFRLSRRAELDAIVTPSDIVASGLIAALKRRGVSVPADVAVTGFNNQFEGIVSHPPLTTVDPDYAHRGYLAVELLLDRIASKNLPCQDIVAPVKLVLRQSCGCFEQSITNSVIPGVAEEVAAMDGAQKRELLLRSTGKVFSSLTESKTALADAILEDIDSLSPDSRLMREFQRLLSGPPERPELTTEDCQQLVSELRGLILPLVATNAAAMIRMENILHELRIMVSLMDAYQLKALDEDPLHFNRKTRIALSFSSVTNGAQFRELLRHQLAELGIPGIILLLQQSMTMEPSPALRLELIMPDPPDRLKEELPYTLPIGSFMPRRFLPSDRRHCWMFEQLYHADRYSGCALIEMGPDEAVWYDTIRMLLSQSLFSIHTREQALGDRKSLLSRETPAGLLDRAPDEDNPEDDRPLGTQQVMDYLMEHLDSMTDLTQMARDLSISKSHLARKVKALTGYTVRVLHERMKIEQAQKLLYAGDIPVSRIAEQLGFQNQSYFSTVFKRVTGSSPSEWLKGVSPTL